MRMQSAVVYLSSMLSLLGGCGFGSAAVGAAVGSKADGGRAPVNVRVEFFRGGDPQPHWARPGDFDPTKPTPEFAFQGLTAPRSGGIDVDPLGEVGNREFSGFVPVSFQLGDTGRFTFWWDTASRGDPGDYTGDLVDLEVHVRLRMTVVQSGNIVGADEVSFDIDNNEPPRAVLDGDVLVQNPDSSGVIPVPIRLFDDESDPVRVLVQWRRQDQSFPELPNTRSDLLDLLDNPERASERRALQIATEAIPEPAGRVGFLPGLGNDQVRLPELASTASDVASRGIAGGMLEILRPNDVPAPVTWTQNPLDRPVATLPAEDGLSALVLDHGAAGWRLRRLDLETGEVRGLMTGSGVPRCLTQDPSGKWIFVGTDLNILRLSSSDGSLRETVSHGFIDGPRALAAMGEDIVLATGDNRLARFDMVRGTTTNSITGLQTPFGLERDPLEQNSVYLAEQSGSRIVHINLDRQLRQQVVAAVAPGDVGALGSQPFPRPRGLAVERGGSRLVVWTQSDFETSPSLRELDLRKGEGATPFVHQVVAGLASDGACIGVGIDHLRIVCLSESSALAVGGGVITRRQIVADHNQAYDPRNQVVLLANPFAVPVAMGSLWRIRPSPWMPTSPGGSSSVFRWDASAATPGSVALRIVPLDTDVGTTGSSIASKDLRAFSATPSTVLASGNGPGSSATISLAAADLNGDGRVDLVSGDEGSSTLSVFLQTSSGVFAATPMTLATGLRPFSVTTADLDGNGMVDIVSAGGSNTLSVFFQTVPGVFPTTPSATLTAGDTPAAVVAADLNGDGRADLVSADLGSDTLSIFYQLSPGVFPNFPSATLTTGGNPIFLATADLNGDGRLDLVSADFGSNRLSVFIQLASGGFPTTPITMITGVQPSFVAAADLNGDGRVDLVSADSGSDRLSVFLQTLSGDYPGTPSATLTTLLAPTCVAAADLNGDGRVDLVSADLSGLSVFLQTSSGVFAPTPSAILGLASPQDFVVAADLNGDGNLDLVSADFNVNRLSVFIQESFGEFQSAPSATLTGGGDANATAAADLNGDGRLDLVQCGFGNSALDVFLQTASGEFLSPPLALNTGVNPMAVVAADLNGDGRVDLASADQGSKTLSVFFQAASGFPSTPITLWTGNFFTALKGLVATDLNRDGMLDLVLADSGNNRLAVFLQGAPGVFPSTPMNLTTGSRPYSVSAADLDGDGRVDLLSADFGNDRLSVFLQAADGAFPSTPTLTLPTGLQPIFVLSADLDGDGRTDVVSADYGGNRLSVFLQAATGTFPAAPTVLNTGIHPFSVAAPDVNGDGRLDLIVADQGSDRLSVFVQGLSGAFSSTPSTLTTGSNPLFVAAGDVNGDGRSDLVSADSRGLRVFINP